MNDKHYDLKNNDSDAESTDVGSSPEETAENSDWDIPTEKTGMATGTKVGIGLIALLVGVMGFGIYKKMTSPSEELAEVESTLHPNEQSENSEPLNLENEEPADPFSTNTQLTSTEGQENTNQKDELFTTDRNVAQGQAEPGSADSNVASDLFPQRQEPDSFTSRNSADNNFNSPDSFNQNVEKRPDPYSSSEQNPFGAEPAETESTSADFGSNLDNNDFSQPAESNSSANNDFNSETKSNDFSNPEVSDQPYDSQNKNEFSSEDRSVGSRNSQVGSTSDDLNSSSSSNDFSSQNPDSNTTSSNTFGSDTDSSNSFGNSDQFDNPDQFGSEEMEKDDTFSNGSNDNSGSPDYSSSSSSEDRFGDYRPLETEQRQAESSTTIQDHENSPQKDMENYFADDSADDFSNNSFDSNSSESATDSFSNNDFSQPKSSQSTSGSQKDAPFSKSSSTTNSFERSDNFNTQNTFRSSSSEEYTVEPNDNFWSISKKQYGTARYFNALVMYNKNRIPDPRKMRPGMKVLTPDRSVLEAQFPKLVPRQSTPASTDSFERKPSSDFSQPNQIDRSTTPKEGGSGFFVGESGRPLYRIGTDDTLTEIALQHLGRSSRWRQIYHLNRSKLKNPNNLTVGTILELPADASRVSLMRRTSQTR